MDILREGKRFTMMLAVPSAVTSAEVKANISARPLKRFVKRRIWEFSPAVLGRGPK